MKLHLFAAAAAALLCAAPIVSSADADVLEVSLLAALVQLQLPRAAASGPVIRMQTQLAAGVAALSSLQGLVLSALRYTGACI